MNTVLPTIIDGLDLSRIWRLVLPCALIAWVLFIALISLFEAMWLTATITCIACIGLFVYLGILYEAITANQNIPRTVEENTAFDSAVRLVVAYVALIGLYFSLVPATGSFGLIPAIALVCISLYAVTATPPPVAATPPPAAGGGGGQQNQNAANQTTNKKSPQSFWKGAAIVVLAVVMGLLLYSNFIKSPDGIKDVAKDSFGGGNENNNSAPQVISEPRRDEPIRNIGVLDYYDSIIVHDGQQIYMTFVEDDTSAWSGKIILVPDIHWFERVSPEDEENWFVGKRLFDGLERRKTKYSTLREHGFGVSYLNSEFRFRGKGGIVIRASNRK